jgi:hypothetical protein
MTPLRIRVPPLPEFSDSDSDSDTGMSEEMSPTTLTSETEFINRPPFCSNLCCLRQIHKLILLWATVLFAILLYHV